MCVPRVLAITLGTVGERRRFQADPTPQNQSLSQCLLQRKKICWNSRKLPGSDPSTPHFTSISSCSGCTTSILKQLSCFEVKVIISLGWTRDFVRTFVRLALQDPDCFSSICWTEQTPSGGQLNICQLHSSLIKNENVRNNVYSSLLHNRIKYQQFAYIVYFFSRGAWPFLVDPHSEGSSCLHSTLQKGEYLTWGLSAAQPPQWLQISLRSFLTKSLSKPETSHSLTLLGSQTVPDLANTFPDAEVLEGAHRQLAALLFFLDFSGLSKEATILFWAMHLEITRPKTIIVIFYPEIMRS